MNSQSQLSSALWTAAVPLAAYYVAGTLDEKDQTVLLILRAVYGVVALADVFVLLRTRAAFLARPDHTVFAYFSPAVLTKAKRLKREPEPEQATITTHLLYDEQQWRSMLTRHVLGHLVCVFMHVVFHMLTPVCVGIAATPLNLVDAPLVRIHLLKQKPTPTSTQLSRPFGAPESLWSAVGKSVKELRRDVGSASGTGAAAHK